MSEMKGQFVRYNPPADLTVLDREPRLQDLGVQFETSRSPFRCGQCRRLYEAESDMSYVRDGFRVGDDWRALVQSYQGNRYNASGSGWCVACTHDLLPKTSPAYLKYKTTGEYPRKVYLDSKCQFCEESVIGRAVYVKTLAEDTWQVYCQRCGELLMDDPFKDGFGLNMPMTCVSIGSIAPGESVSVRL